MVHTFGPPPFDWPYTRRHSFKLLSVVAYEKCGYSGNSTISSSGPAFRNVSTASTVIGCQYLIAVTATGSMYGETASTKRTRCRSVSNPIGDRRPISAYFPATGIDRREEISFASGFRKKPSGP